MKGPSDQAKLLLLGLLRTVSALATEPRAALSSLSYASNTIANTPITLRQARRADVPGIQRCNLATLPENYNPQFYVNHLRAWPELALVAETVPENNNGYYNNEPNIVAYVLGKVEERTVEVGIQDYAADYQYGVPQQQPQYMTERIGHVTSLAVLPSARRLGLAQSLMEQLHCHLSLYNVQQVGLHVRQSNYAAGKLYRNQGYSAVEQIPRYYQDGEDAYFMKKTLSQPQQQQQQQQQQQRRGWPEQRFWGTARQRPLIPNELQLPRYVGRQDLTAPEQLLGTL